MEEVRGADTSYRGTTFSERMAGAPCMETDPDLSFPSGTGKREIAHIQAKKNCARCPIALREECLEMAMRTEGRAVAANRYGVFGGLDPVERAELAKERRTERPTSPHTADHGTAARARVHRRAGETPCGPCLNAESATWQRRPRKRVTA